VDIESTVRRDVEKRGRQEHPVSRHNHGVRRNTTQPRSCFGIEALGLKNLDAALIRETLHRARGGLQSAASPPVRLRQNQRNLMSGLQQAGERPCGEIGSASEN
jgi:hypothetical protein